MENDFRTIRKLRKVLNIPESEFSQKSEEEKQILLKLRRIERILTYKYDFQAFVVEVLNAEDPSKGYTRLGKVHFRLMRAIRRAKNLGRNILIRLPRYHLKTQICTIYYRIWRAVNNPELCSVIVSGTLELSKDTCRSIRQELISNEKLRMLYPDVLPSWLSNERKNKWSETEFNVARKGNHAQATIEGYGINATVTGKHFDEISFDDVVTKENSETPEQCAKVIKAYTFFLSIVNPRKERGRIPIIVVGTNYTDSDLYSWLDRPEVQPLFLHFTVPIPESLDPIWPEYYTRQMLLEIQSQQGSYTFSTQYHLNPVPESQQEFKRSWIQIYRDLPTDALGNDIPLSKLVMVDPITAKKTTSTSSDRGVVLVAGWDKRSNIYVLDYELFDRARESELFSSIFKLSEKWQVQDIGWEDVAYQTQGRYNLMELSQSQNRNLKVWPMKPGNRDKDVRIRTMIPHFERGQIFIRYWMNELILELLRFPHGKTKDIIDTLSYVLRFVLDRRKRPNPFRSNIPLQATPEKAWYL